jgi:nicotinamide mononucleotide transporter
MIEIVAIIFSLSSVWLTTKKNIWCWPIGIIGIFFYFLLFKNSNQICNMSLQVFFIMQSIYGWSNWKKEDKISISLYNEMMLISSYIPLIIDILFVSFIWYTITHIFGGTEQLLDSITTGLSIIAMFLLSEKKLEAWVLWIIADILYIPLFILSGHYLSAVTYFTFLVLSIFGFINWSKLYKNGK